MSDEDYGQFTTIDISHDIFKLKYKKQYVTSYVKNHIYKELDYYNQHYHIDVNEYASNNTLTTINSSNFTHDIDKDIVWDSYYITKSWFVYATILLTSAWSIYLIFSL